MKFAVTPLVLTPVVPFRTPQSRVATGRPPSRQCSRTAKWWCSLGANSTHLYFAMPPRSADRKQTINNNSAIFRERLAHVQVTNQGGHGRPFRVVGFSRCLYIYIYIYIYMHTIWGPCKPPPPQIYTIWWSAFRGVFLWGNRVTVGQKERQSITRLSTTL